MNNATVPGLLKGDLALHEREFTMFQRWIYHRAGIALSPVKKALVAGRLARRVQHHGFTSFEAYFELVNRDQDEHQVALDLLTTNETHFFREPRHFELLARTILPSRPAGRALRVWSAAASTGQEPYTLAMVLAEELGASAWDVLGTDISSRALDRARSALYDMALAAEIPSQYLRAYCLRGVGEQAGRFAIAPEVARRVTLAQVNLNEPLPEVGDFDVIFLRNVMIYFDERTKRSVVERLTQRLRPGGWFVVGHSETLNGLSDELVLHAPSVYRLPR